MIFERARTRMGCGRTIIEVLYIYIYIYIYIYYIYIDYIYIHRAVKETLKLLHHVIPSSIIHFACVHFELSRPELRCDRSDI